MLNELDLGLTDVGLPCEEYTLIIIAGPNNLPPAVREKMNQHLEACAYHNSRTFTESALGTPVTPKLEVAALEVISKYS